MSLRGTNEIRAAKYVKIKDTGMADAMPDI